jgi:hypothetical protein
LVKNSKINKKIHMKNLLFELLAYGITNIAVFGSIFEKWRNFWVKTNPSFFGKLFSCPMCLSFYVGGVLSLVFNNNGWSTPFFDYGITSLPLTVFLDSCFTSGCVWLVHNLEEFFERGFTK